MNDAYNVNKTDWKKFEKYLKSIYDSNIFFFYFFYWFRFIVRMQLILIMTDLLSKYNFSEFL